MFKFLKTKSNPSPIPSAQSESSTIPTTSSMPTESPPPANKNSLFNRLRQGLAKTRANFSTGLANLVLGKKKLDQEVINEIETILLSADVGFETTTKLIATLTAKLARNELNDSHAAIEVLKTELRQILAACEHKVNAITAQPQVILMVGVNGSGKTTSLGKLAHFYKSNGYRVILAAGDTFRAAAIEQLQIWGERNQVPVIAQNQGADTAAVIYDAFTYAKARSIDILLADTAGRLHTQQNLMAELQKVKRVLGKIDANAPHEVFIVLDACLGQNALNQVQQFNAAIGITGIILTKLDGTAKGGIIFNIAAQTKIPIRYIGIGEGLDDLRIFNSDDFVNALFEPITE